LGLKAKAALPPKCGPEPELFPTGLEALGIGGLALTLSHSLTGAQLARKLAIFWFWTVSERCVDTSNALLLLMLTAYKFSGFIFAESVIAPIVRFGCKELSLGNAHIG